MQILKKIYTYDILHKHTHILYRHTHMLNKHTFLAHKNLLKDVEMSNINSLIIKFSWKHFGKIRN